jgi:hypothetical protein
MNLETECSLLLDEGWVAVRYNLLILYLILLLINLEC